jgi:penicillin-binding protein 1A
MGSIFKPLVYAAAIEAGVKFSDTDIDEPFEMAQFNGNIWRPHNYNEQFNGQISLAYALSHSNNIVTIKTLLKTGAKPIIDLAKKCHIQGPFHEFPSLALGCIDATLKEVVGMFNVFANNGVYVEPHFIKWVKDQWGTKIYKFTPEKNVVMHSSVSSQVSKVLMHSLERIHQAWNGSWLPCQAISKTGTTNDSRICWYAGSTPQLTTALYIGCDNNSSLGKNIYPSRTAFPIWFELNRKFAKSSAEFIFDPSLKEVLIDEKTARVAYAMEPGIIKILA